MSAERWTCNVDNPSGTTGCAREQWHGGDHQAGTGETWPQDLDLFITEYGKVEG